MKFYNDEFTYPIYNNKIVTKFGNYKNFVYDSNNRLTQFDDILINYDSENRVIKVLQSNSKYEQFFRFEYDNDSNLKKIYTSKDFYGLNGQDVTIFSSTFDKQINPYYDLPVEVKIYILTSNLFARLPYSFTPTLLFSKNNFLTIKDDVYGTNDISQQLITLKNLLPQQFERFSPKSSVIDKVNIKYNCP